MNLRNTLLELLNASSSVVEEVRHAEDSEELDASPRLWLPQGMNEANYAVQQNIMHRRKATAAFASEATSNQSWHSGMLSDEASAV